MLWIYDLWFIVHSPSSPGCNPDVVLTKVDVQTLELGYLLVCPFRLITKILLNFLKLSANHVRAMLGKCLVLDSCVFLILANLLMFTLPDDKL